MSRLALVLSASLCATALGQQGVAGSKHDLSVTGPGPVRAASETRVCIFCHVGHGGEALGQNRPSSEAAYQPYGSTTLRSNVRSTPSGATRVCLSCHDGTIALGKTLASGTIPLVGAAPDGRMPLGASNLGTDLRRTHPVSFAAVPSDTAHPPKADTGVKLDRKGELQCTACHDPHREDADPVVRKFLVASNRYSAVCTSCHELPSWATNPSAHQSSPAPYDVARGAPTAYGTVAENGCAACHGSHGADEGGRLLRARRPEEGGDALCLSCHDGKVAALDVSRDAAKPYAHADRGPDRIHDAAEQPRDPRHALPETSPSQRRHATCVDCHEPHAAFHRPALAPRPSGALAGAWGIDLSGSVVRPVEHEYELCFKCHADSANQPQARAPIIPGAPRRAAQDVNLRRAFAPDAASAHPVASPGRSADVPSLVPPLTAASQIYCSDCHASDTGKGAGGQGPSGPHGSIYPFLLERNLSTADRTVESPFAYALCYKCHARDAVLSDASPFAPHRRHVVDQSTPCTACHASHGISADRGNPVNNAHLIDFDLAIVRASGTGLLEYSSRGARSGACSLSCHGHEHAGSSY